MGIAYVAIVFVLACALAWVLTRDMFARTPVRRDPWIVVALFVAVACGIACCFSGGDWMCARLVLVIALVAILLVRLMTPPPNESVDSRTGALTREGMRALIASRQNDHRSIAALGVALKHFEDLRLLNDADKIDQALRLVADKMSGMSGVLGVAYLGRGRFVVLGDDEFDPMAAHADVVRCFAQPWDTPGVSLYLQVSVAVLPATRRIDSAEEVLSTLDSAMNEAVLAKDGDLVVLDAKALDRFDEHAHIRRVLERTMQSNAVEVFYQPLYDTRVHRVSRAEALARLRDDDGSFISPESFIAIAEGAGIIGELGEQIFEEVCAFASQTDLDALGIDCINVNLSPLQCLSAELPQRLRAIADRYGVPMERLHLEITESAKVDVSVLREQMGLLVKTGSRFSLDDYGTGYSNISRMASLPFANVKLDQSIVRDYFGGSGVHLPALVDSFHELGLEVTAEGVETKAMVDGLTQMGCDLLQGFYFSRALPADAFVAYVADWPKRAPELG